MTMAMLAALLMALAGTKPAKVALAGFSEGHGPIDSLRERWQEGETLRALDESHASAPHCA